MDTEGKIRMLKVQEERLLVIMENAQSRGIDTIRTAPK